MKHILIAAMAAITTVSVSAQTGGREIIIVDGDDEKREIIDIRDDLGTRDISTVRVNGGKIEVNGTVDGQRRDTVIEYGGGPVVVGVSESESVIVDSSGEPINIDWLREPVIIEEPSDCAKDGVYVKNGKEFLFGDSGATPTKARFGVIGGHWSGISFGYSGLISGMRDWGLPEEGAYFEQRANSPSFNINIIGLEILSTRHFAITTGVGLEFNNYRFREPMILRRSSEGTYPDYTIRDSGGRTDKSKLSTNYINIPLLAEFRFGCKNGYSGKAGYLYGGVIGGWGYNVHSKVKYNNGSGRLRRTKDHNVGTTNFRYGYIVGVGYSHYGVYMQYYPDPVFKDGPRVRQVSIGLSFNWGKVR